MAVVIFLSGFLLGLLALALAEGAALLWAVRALRRGRPRPPSPPPEAAAAVLSGDRPVPTEKQGFLWMLEPEKMPKVSINNHIPSGAKKDMKEKKNIVEVFPVRMLAKIKDHLLVLSGPDGSQTSIQLLDCTVVAVSSSNLPSRKWAKRYPIKLESKGSEICKGSNVCYLYAETSWEKESWSKALRLASSTDEQKLNLLARLSEQFRSYVSSLNAGYPRFLESSALSTDYHQVRDKAVKSDGSTKLRLLLKKFSRKVSTKAPQVTRTSTIPAQAERKTFGKTHSYHGTSLIDLPEERSSSSSSSQDIKQPSTPGSDFSYRSRFSDSPDANTDEKNSDDGTLCWNLLISRLFFDAKMSDEISKAIKARIQRSLSNMRTASYIGEITLTDLNLGELPPYLRRMRVLPRDLNELWAFEVDFEYCGGIMLHTEARLEIQEPELQKDIMKTTLEADSNGAVNSEFLENIEHYGNQVESSQLLASVVEDEDEAGVLKRSKSTGWKRWKNIVHSITDHVSQVPFLLAIKIASVRGTMRIQIKPPPCDRIWYGFTSMPELEWELESSIGERKITNSHIAAFISKRIKASLHQSLVLPNCESIPVSWMISEKDDWVPRKVAPFIWLNREPSEAASHNTDTGTLQPDDVATLKVSANQKGSKSCPPAPLNDGEQLKNTISFHGPNQEPATDASTSSCSSLPSETEPSDQLTIPLMSTTRQFERNTSEDASGSSLQLLAMVPAGERSLASSSASPDEYMKRKGARRAAVIGLGRRMSNKLEDKRRHIVEKIKENAAHKG
ncbi:hypothetical protein QYE76_033868 [Lolium multiflorum]|uniref:SMP-LTD domain-containing protein n=1 Tax=Lolium multiflorum TaxID=4521 RepID=A0AAD8QXH8_LOLMU|nr:hypothetical protein QYE76_033868 [Lolium multiflorum]